MINSKKILLSLALVFVLPAANLLADDAKARAIMKKVYTREDGKTLEQDMRMILIDKNGKKRIRDMKSYSKDFGSDKYQIIFVKSPTDLKNTAFLTYDYGKTSKNNDQWLYLPVLKKAKHIHGSGKSSSFMGSDFSYYDMNNHNLKDYSFKLLKEITLKGYSAWVIESTPRTSKVLKKSGYIKAINVIEKKDYAMMRSTGYLKNGKKKYFDVTRAHKQDGIWVADEITMTTKKGKVTVHKTILKFSNIKLNKPIKDTMFSVRRMKKGL